MSTNLSRLEEALHASCRLDVVGEYDSWTASGFLMKIENGSGLQSDLLFTCKHVVEGAKELNIRVRRRVGPDPIRHPVLADVNINLSQSLIVAHDVEDVCAIFVHPVMKLISEADGAWPLVFSFSTNHLCDLNELDALEEFVMIGSPSGMFDDFNNHPIMRRGVTASHPGYPYKGRQQFLVDCPSHSGSSGSPIVRYGNLFFDRNAGDYDIAMHPRIALLGMLSSGFDDAAPGYSGQHIDLGLAVSSAAISDVIASCKGVMGWQ